MITLSAMTKQRSLFAASAAAIGAVGFVTVPLAQGVPMIPLAPACTFNGNYVLNQSNGFRVEFPWNGKSPSGTAIAFGNNQKPALTGPVSGGIASDNTVNFVIDWDGPSQGQYTSGPISPTGFVSGTTRDLGAPSSTASWESVTPLNCVEASTPAQVPAQQVPAQQVPAQQAPAKPTATVNSDVDLYDKAEGNIIGILRKGQVVTVVTSCSSNAWCDLVDPAGAAWGQYLTNN